MPAPSPDDLRSRYPSHRWTRIEAGDSGASVWRLDGPSELYVKQAVDADDEAACLHWLAEHDIPVPTILDAGPGWLATTVLSGRSAEQPWPVEDRGRVVDAIADLTLRLHALPTAACPFDRRLAASTAAARANAAAGIVDLDDVDAERAGWSAADLVAALDASVPSTEDVVVCHGDLCLPNVLIDPTTLRATGFVDVGRLGLADRYNDLAIATRSLGMDTRNAQFGPPAADRFLARYGAARDEARLAFYRLLDEFF